jgi:hypothetical protein
VIDVGVTAASSGGPRFDPTLTERERTGIANGLWLCQNCAKLIDSDVNRFSAAVLRGWKLGSEWDAKKRLGKTNVRRRPEHHQAEKEIKCNHKLRDDLQRAMLKSNDDRMKGPREQSRLWKFAAGEFIVHRLGDTLYPARDNNLAISNWFRLGAFDFYHNGLEGIVSLEYALVSQHTRQWAPLGHREHEHSFPHGFRPTKVFKTGRIPWRNIKHFDLRGDEFYNCPHLYCLYADDGMPYESFGYYKIAVNNSYEFELSRDERVDLGVLLGTQANLNVSTDPSELLH